MTAPTVDEPRRAPSARQPGYNRPMPHVKWPIAGVVLALGLGIAHVALGVGPAASRPVADATQLAVASPAAPRPTATFADVVARASTLPRLRSLLVSVDGQIVEERYFRGATAARAENLKSASKSIIALLVGIALDRGLLKSLDQPIGPFFPQYLKGQPEKAAITIGDLVSMRAGLEATSGRDYGRWVLSGNWVRHALQQPFEDEPGGRMVYSTGSSHLLSAILTRVSGMSTLEFARRHLGKPLGITIPAWTRDPQGIYLGGNEMHLRSRDLLKIGELVLNEGRAGNRQVVSEQWLRESAVPRTVSRFSGTRAYGYGWWLRELADYDVVYAWGYGGQFAFVIPDLRAVVVTTSVSDPGSERRDHLDGIYDLVEETVIPAIEGTPRS
jgi:CubicO group peptidase (beta-lactamase class C family)